MSNHPSPGNVQKKRPLIYILPGILLFCGAGLLIYDRMQVHTTIAPKPQTYKYSVQQNVTNVVAYHQSSFFNGGPGPSNTAYISDLTDHINSTLQYKFQGSEATDLTYTYGATAVVRGTYGSESTEQGLANIWSKEYLLQKPVTGNKNTKDLVLNPTFVIPFDTYKKDMDQFRTSFSTPLNSELVVTYTVQVSGKVNGTPFNNTKTATINAPLDQQVFLLANKFTKNDKQEVIPATSQKLEDVITTYEMPVAILLAMLGLVYTVYGMRSKIFKSTYQRELERIYRYHDGIIIRASRPTNLANKNIVSVQSFDDLLNLEEEVKSPIIASPVGHNVTQFLITKDDIVYVYTLGELVPFAQPNQSVENQIRKREGPPKRKVMG